MAICQSCGKNYSKWTTPVSARGVCGDCFKWELNHKGERRPREDAAFSEIATAEKPRSRRTLLSSFLPRSRSKAVFVLAMTCYSWAATRLLSTIAGVFGAPSPPPGEFEQRGYFVLEAVSLVLLAPILESLILIGIIELLRKLRSPAWLQITLAAIICSIPHIPLSYALVVSPAFFIMAAAYLRWRRVSWKVGFVVIASIHGLLNLTAAIWAFSDAIEQASS